MKTNPNDQITPAVNEGTIIVEGLTKREYFSAIILQGLLAGRSDYRDKPTMAVGLSDQLIYALNREQDLTK